MEDSIKNRIEELLKEECGLCHVVWELTKEAEKSVQDGSIEEADENLKKSFERAEKIKSIEEEIGEILKGEGIAIDELKDEYTGLVSEISYLIGEISELDNNVRVLLNKRKEIISEEMGKIKVGKKVFSKYFDSGKSDKGNINIIE